MAARDAVTGKPAWAHEFRLGELAHGPVTRTLSAEPVERMRLAQELSLDRLDSLSATLTVSPWLDGVKLEGLWSATIEQTCGVTLEAFVSELEGEFTVHVLPRGSTHAPSEISVEITVDPDADDPPDLIDGDRVDLAAYVVEHLSLEIDPFPRRPGAVFEPREEESPPSPFAVLLQLKTNPDEE